MMEGVTRNHAADTLFSQTNKPNKQRRLSMQQGQKKPKVPLDRVSGKVTRNRPERM
jgi:hypothetical protein